MSEKLKLLVVGSFLAEEKEIFGGIAKSCQTMMQSSFPDRFSIITVDSTQISNPAPGLLTRSAFAFCRFVVFVSRSIRHRPDGVLLFTAFGFSFFEGKFGRALYTHTHNTHTSPHTHIPSGAFAVLGTHKKAKNCALDRCIYTPPFCKVDI